MSWKITKDRIERLRTKQMQLYEELAVINARLCDLGTKLKATCPHPETRSMTDSEICLVCNKVQKVCQVTDKTSLGDRMKEYESVPKIVLTRRMPLIVRIDGRAFHTWTQGLDKPWDLVLEQAFWCTCLFLCKEISGTKLTYSQSDEISLLVTDYDQLGTQPWFGKELQKVVSVAASLTTAYFNSLWGGTRNPATFDARAFVLPKEEVCNYFIWRQQDATKNSVSSLARAHFPHKRLQNLSGPQKQDLLFKEKGINWDDIETYRKRGFCIMRNENGTPFVDLDIPIFTQDRDCIDRHVYLDGEKDELYRTTKYSDPSKDVDRGGSSRTGSTEPNTSPGLSDEIWNCS